MKYVPRDLISHSKISSSELMRYFKTNQDYYLQELLWKHFGQISLLEQLNEEKKNKNG